MKATGRLPRLTGTGAAVLLGGGALLGMGLVGGYSGLAGLGTAAQALVLVAVALVWLPARVEGHRTVAADRVPVGSGRTCDVAVRNSGRMPVIRTEAVDRVGDGEFGVTLPPLARGGTARVEYAVPTPRRGLLPLGPLLLIRRDPLGLAHRTRLLAASAGIWVHPRVHPLQNLPAGTLVDVEGA